MPLVVAALSKFNRKGILVGLSHCFKLQLHLLWTSFSFALNNPVQTCMGGIVIRFDVPYMLNEDHSNFVFLSWFEVLWRTSEGPKLACTTSTYFLRSRRNNKAVYAKNNYRKPWIPGPPGFLDPPHENHVRSTFFVSLSVIESFLHL